MSANGNGDDDDRIDDLVRELRNTNQNLEELSTNLDRFINSMIRGAEEQMDEELESPVIDMWEEGTMPVGTANSVDEYIRLRSTSAKSDELVVPQVGSGIGVVELFHEVYVRKGEHLQRIFQGCSNAQWKRFVQRLAVSYGAEAELVDILDPDPIYFGIRVLDREVNVFSSSTHFNFIFAYDNHWMNDSIEFRSPNNSGGPWETLVLQEPNPDDWFTVEGNLDSDDVNEKLAHSIADHGGKSLPDKFITYL